MALPHMEEWIAAAKTEPDELKSSTSSSEWASKRAELGTSNDRVATIYRALRHAIIEQALSPGASCRRTPSASASARAAPSCATCWNSSPPGAGRLRQPRRRGSTPSWEEARDVFDVRIGLERLIVSRLAGHITPEQSAVEAHG